MPARRPSVSTSILLAAAILIWLPVAFAAPPNLPPKPPVVRPVIFTLADDTVEDLPAAPQTVATNSGQPPATPPAESSPPKSGIGNLLNQQNPPGSAEPPPMTTPMPTTADAPVSSVSSLLSQLSRTQERAAQSAAPATTGVDASAQTGASSVDTTQLVKQSSSATSISGVRRSAVSIQPVIRGYQQPQIYAQYQGANFVPARLDFDSILTNIDPGVIDNLIIIPGPYGVKYGPGLSFIDIVATPTPRFECPEFHSRTNVLYQSNGGQFYGRQAFTGGGADYGFRFSAGQKVGSDYRSGDDTQIPASYNVRDVDLAVGFDLDEITKLEIEYLTQDMLDTEFAGLIFDARFRKTDALFLRLVVDDPSSARWLFESWVNRTTFRGDNLNLSKQFFYRNNPFFNSSPMPFPHVSFTGFTTAETTNAGFRLAPTWGREGDVQVTAGVDFHYVAQQLDEFDLFEDKALQSSLVGYDNYPIPPARSYDPGVFFELKFPIDDDLTVTTGARVDMVTSDADATHRAVAPDGTIPPIISTSGVVVDSFETLFGVPFYQRDVLLAAFVAADYRLTEELQLRAGFGHGERPASATERYGFIPFLTIVQNPSNFPLGDPSLNPEKANQFDLALIGNYDDARFQISGFASLVEDYITLDVLPLPAGPAGLRYTNTNATLAGFEAASEYDLDENWSVFSNMSYVDGRNQSRGEPLPSIYPFQSRVGVRWHDEERKRYGVEFSARIVRGQDRVAERLMEPTTPGFSTFDLRAYWQVDEHWRFNAGIENITNKNYLEHLNVHDPAVLEPGTNIFVAVQLDY